MASRFITDPLGSIIASLTRLEVSIVALQSLLIEKGVLTAEEVEAEHASVLAEHGVEFYNRIKAWLDEEFPEDSPESPASPPRAPGAPDPA